MRQVIEPVQGSVWLAAALLAVMALACANDDAVLGVAAPPAGPTVSFSRDIQPVFSANCAVSFCHGSPLGAPMSLQESDSYAVLVGVPSCEAPTLDRVEAGSSAVSYLMLKLQGTQSSVLAAGNCAACDYGFGPVSDCGARMPLTGPPYLPDATLDLIRTWIDQGANDN